MIQAIGGAAPVEQGVSLGIVGTEDTPVNVEFKSEAPDWKTWCECVPSFLSLDISARGTGWVSWLDGELTWGRISLQETETAARVEEFRERLTELFANRAYEYYFVEDIIASCNFKTFRVLASLNNVPDLLIHDGVLHKPISLYRIPNTTWKKHLRGIVGEVVVKGVHYTNGSDKEQVKACLEALGMSVVTLKGTQYTEKQVEDICDALGMALGTIAVEIEHTQPVKTKVVSTDIRKGYKIKQFIDYSQAVQSANRIGNNRGIAVKVFDLVDEEPDSNLIYFMAKQLEQEPNAVYVVYTPVSKCCNLLLMKRLETSESCYYLVIHR